MSRRWQLLDRPVEQEAIRSALGGAESCGVILVGAAGVGKTTLARNVIASPRSKVRWAACTESSRSIPLGAFAHWVSSSALRDPVALIASARESILADENTVVGIDDAHLLDQLSATLLHQIAVERAGHILATVRSGEPVPTPSPRYGRTVTYSASSFIRSLNSRRLRSLNGFSAGRSRV